MTAAAIIIIVAAAFALSMGLTKALIGFTLSRGILDTPNNRSSHTLPTPRGGGIAIVATLLLSLFAVNFIYFTHSPVVTLCLFLAFAISAIGWLDDLFNLSVKIRLLVQVSAAMIPAYLTAQYFFSPSEQLAFFLTVFLLGSGFIIWSTNLFNFMDGIDGIVSLEVIAGSALLSAFCFYLGNLQVSTFWLLVIPPVLGFYYFNKSPAKIFMGDVGSAFLGYVVSLLCIYTTTQTQISIFTMITIFAAFYVDATYTLFVRFYLKQKVYAAHRDHAYQHAVQMGHSHSKVSFIYFLITLFWLGPMAFLGLSLESPLAFLIIACLPLIFLCFKTKAGIRGEN